MRIFLTFAKTQDLLKEELIFPFIYHKMSFSYLCRENTAALFLGGGQCTLSAWCILCKFFITLWQRNRQRITNLNKSKTTSPKIIYGHNGNFCCIDMYTYVHNNSSKKWARDVLMPLKVVSDIEHSDSIGSTLWNVTGHQRV